MFSIKKYLKWHYTNDTQLWHLAAYIYNMINLNKIKTSGKNNKIISTGSLMHKVSLTIAGDNNTIILNSGSFLKNVRILIRGSNHKLLIGRFCSFKGELLFEDNDCLILIGDNTTSEGTHIAVTEPHSRIEIGCDCMFAQDIQIRTGDSHSIIDTTDNKRINYAKNVIIDDHVWIGSGAKILKGTTIGANSIIATASIVTKQIPPNVIAGGAPAEVIRNNVTWDRKRTYSNNL